MTHKQEDIDAAEEYAKQYHEKTEQKESVAKYCFLAGIEHKQKEVDELVDMLVFANRALKAVTSMGATKPVIDRVEQLIQKHAK